MSSCSFDQTQGNLRLMNDLLIVTFCCSVFFHTVTHINETPFHVTVILHRATNIRMLVAICCRRLPLQQERNWTKSPLNILTHSRQIWVSDSVLFSNTKTHVRLCREMVVHGSRYFPQTPQVQMDFLMVQKLLKQRRSNRCMENKCLIITCSIWAMKHYSCTRQNASNTKSMQNQNCKATVRRRRVLWYQVSLAWRLISKKFLSHVDV